MTSPATTAFLHLHKPPYLQNCTVIIVGRITVITHRRSVYEVDVFSGVCLFVCPHDNSRTTKRKTIKLGS